MSVSPSRPRSRRAPGDHRASRALPRRSTVSTVILWDTATGKWLFAQQFFELLSRYARGPIATAVLAPDHRRVVLAINNRAPVIWRIAGDLPHYVP